MPTIHPSAILDGEIDLADDVVVGPHCVLTGAVRVGTGTRFIGSVYVQGPTTIGRENLVYPNVSLGFCPQAVSYDPAEPGCGLVVGDGNTLREGVTMHRAMTDEGPTRVGDHNFFMSNAHVGHDCQVGDHCTVASGEVLGGHVRVGEGVTLGGLAGVHQHVHLGRGSMLSGLACATQNVIPFGLVTSFNVCANVNLIGMRRRGMTSEEIDVVRWAHRTICRSKLTLAGALNVLRERADDPLVREYIEFVEGSKRAICVSHERARRASTNVRLDVEPGAVS